MKKSLSGKIQKMEEALLSYQKMFEEDDNDSTSELAAIEQSLAKLK